ncbi:MAG: hypothetical protein WA991_13300 [Ornithinimicrobium sp.]
MSNSRAPLDPTWLQETLGWSATAVSYTRIATDRGFAGVVLRVEITSEAGHVSTVIAKVGPDDSFGAEIDFYSRYAVTLGAPVPRCYFAEPAPTEHPCFSWKTWPQHAKAMHLLAQPSTTSQQCWSP